MAIAKIFTVLFAAIFAVTSCVVTRLESEQIEPEGEEISFGSNVTRAPVGTQTDPSAGMSDYSVWGWCSPTMQTTPATSPASVFDGQRINSQTGSYDGRRYWVDGMTYGFYALHPYAESLTQSATGMSAPSSNVTCTSDGVITVKDFDASARGKNAIDLMTACSKKSWSIGMMDQSVPLSFKHELAQVEFMISSEQAVTIDYVQLKNAWYKANMTASPDFSSIPAKTLTVWELTGKSSSIDGSPFVQNEPIEIYETQVNTHRVSLLGGALLVPPQSLIGCEFTMQWTYRADANEYRIVNVPLDKALYGVESWERGKRYVYSAVIPPTPTDVVFTLTVLPWNEKQWNADL